MGLVFLRLKRPTPKDSRALRRSRPRTSSRLRKATPRPLTRVRFSLHRQALSFPSRDSLVDFLPVPADGMSPGTPTITVNYEDSSISSFNLETMYYACTLATEASLTSVPTSCNMTVTGFGPPSSGSKQLATQTFPFVSNGGLEQDMTEGVFLSTFQGLYSAVFTLSSADTALTAGLVDNVGNMIFSSSPVVVN